jgi:hypothetical protein
MKDLIFYYTKKTDSLLKRVEVLSKKYPFAKVKFLNLSVNNFIRTVSMNSFTKFTWLIDVENYGWEDILEYNVEEWDEHYLHIFENKESKIYLIPKNLKFYDNSEEFPDKKFIKANELNFKKYDVFFICYDENIASKNLKLLKEKCPDVKVIANVKGIFNAHYRAAEESETDFFWVVDADATILDSFNFDYIVPEWDFDVVHIWKSLNLINYLEYGHGGVKLIPKHIILNSDKSTAVDITTSIGANIKIMDEVSNINNFATSPLNAWRTAFRECVKLSSAIIISQVQEETDHRLKVWCEAGGSRPLGEYVKGGASAGCWYGTTHKGNKEMLARINDYDWLALEFENHVKLFPPEQFKDQ